MTPIEKQIAALRYRPREVLRKTRAIYRATLRESRHIRASNFTAIAAEDVERLYRLYDETFFNGLFQRLLSQDGEGGLTFRVSSRMSSAGGKTIRAERRVPAKEGVKTVFAYELAVSARLLFQTFQGEERAVIAAGLPCADRLEALQRIVEHEMVHLLELLVWRGASCDRARVPRLGRNPFAPPPVRHQPGTPPGDAPPRLWVKTRDR